MVKSVQDYESIGFEVVKKPQKTQLKPEVIVAPEPKAPQVIVADNSRELIEVSKTNELMRSAIEKLTAALAQKPKEMQLDIQRNEQGFMTGIGISIKS